MKNFLFSILLLLIVNLGAEEISLNTFVDKNTITIDEYVNFTIEITGKDAKKANFPNLSLSDFDVMSSFSSSSSYFSFVNGTKTSKTTVSQKYILAPKKVGNLTIPEVQINYEGKIYKGKAISVKVEKNNTPQATNTNNNQAPENIFIEIVTDKKSAYLGEAIEVKYYFYTRYNISSLAMNKKPEFNNSWTKTLFETKQLSFTQEVLNGINYNKLLLVSYEMIPQKEGIYTLPTMELIAEIPIAPRDFFDFGSSKKVSLKSQENKVRIKALPQTNLDFSGAVGVFTMNSTLSKENIKNGESFTYTLEIVGHGNLSQSYNPIVPDIEAFKFMDPEVSYSDDQSKKTLKYLVIAQKAGKQILPAFKFTYFNPQEKQYKTLSSKEYSLSVQKASKQNFYYPQNNLEEKNKDISYIETSYQKEKPIYKSIYYYLLYLILLVFLGFSYLKNKEKHKLNNDLVYSKQKQAGKILKKYMKKAFPLAHAKDLAFYEYVQKGLFKYLCDKYNLDYALEIDSIIEKLKAKIDVSLLDKIKSLNEKCNSIRYMPQENISNLEIENDFETLKKILNLL